jgi:hypothetical protein
VLVLCLFYAVRLIAQTAPPDRKALGNVVTSERDPAVRIELPKAAQYVGADRWTLYGIADCELHALVEADAQKKVQRLYWVQFEGYLPSRPDLHHNYDSPKHTTIGGMDFYGTHGFGQRKRVANRALIAITSRRFCVPRVIGCRKQ